jgi:hypothetical protein
MKARSLRNKSLNCNKSVLSYKREGRHQARDQVRLALTPCSQHSIMRRVLIKTIMLARSLSASGSLYRGNSLHEQELKNREQNKGTWTTCRNVKEEEANTLVEYAVAAHILSRGDHESDRIGAIGGHDAQPS